MLLLPPRAGRIYKVTSRATIIFNNDKNLLSELGVKASSVFLTNCTIWVEGITDRIYIRHYLKLYQKYLNKRDSNLKIYNEDIHYSFIEYSGGNITHWSFLDDDDEENPNMNVDAICNSIFLIADNDDTKPNSKKYLQLKEKLGNNFCLLECREIENLLSENVLLGILKEDGFDSDTIKLKHSEYQNKYLGTYLDHIIEKSKYAAESGTIRNKKEFAKKAISHITKYNDLSQEAKDICVRIYEFIKRNNI